jgi:hypothetical protein
MKLSVYLELFLQFFLKHSHTFTFRLGPDKVSVTVELVADKSPLEITLPEAIFVAKYLITHNLNFPTSPFTVDFFIDGDVEVTVVVTKI